MFNRKQHFINPAFLIATFFFLVLVNFPMQATTSEKMTESQAVVQEISIVDAKALYDSGAVFVDTRSKLEMHFGVIEKAIAIGKKSVNEKAVSLIPNKNKVVVTYCAEGVRASVAAKNLIKLGYQNVYVIHDSGYSDWKKAGYPTAKLK